MFSPRLPIQWYTRQVVSAMTCAITVLPDGKLVFHCTTMVVQNDVMGCDGM